MAGTQDAGRQTEAEFNSRSVTTNWLLTARKSSAGVFSITISKKYRVRKHQLSCH